jgi:hypothetical protein
MPTQQQEPVILLFQVLTTDHWRMTEALEQMGIASNDAKEERFAELHGLMTRHLLLEERAFYKEIEMVDELSDLVETCITEHEEMKELLRFLMDVDIDSTEWDEALASLERVKTVHLQREESKLFPRVLQIVDDEGLHRMADHLRVESERMPGPAGREAELPRSTI